ncbi:hypothetical protein ACLMJK_002094 [Lecanora helva]
MEADSQDQRKELPHVPDEILTTIFFHLPRNTELVSFTLASRRFRCLIEEFLYHTLEVRITARRERFDENEWSKLEYVYKLIDHLSRNRKFGLYTRDLSLLTEDVSPALFCKLGKKLFQYLPKLQKLNLSPVHAETIIPQTLPLHSLWLGFDPCEDRFLFESVAQHFWRPSLRTLQLRNMFFTPELLQDVKRLFPLYPIRVKSNIEDIHMIGCFDESVGLCRGLSDATFVQRLLVNVKNLRRFVFTNIRAGGATFEGDEAMHIGPGVPSDVAVGLDSFAETLEELVICVQKVRDKAIPTEFDLSERLSRKFTKLQSLAVPGYLASDDLSRATPILCGEALEEIQLQFTVHIADTPDLDIRHYETMPEMMTMKQISTAKNCGILPRLKRVIWWHKPVSKYGVNAHRCNGSPETQYMSILQSIRTQLELDGVAFEWISTRWLSDTPFGKRLYQPL